MSRLSRAQLQAALLAAYDAAQANNGGAAMQREALVAALTDAAFTLIDASTRRPQENPQNITLADLCRRENLPIPPANAGDPTSAAHVIVLRGYKTPHEADGYWTCTNTGGRKYRFRPEPDSLTERYRGTAWEIVPLHHIPILVVKLREAIALGHTTHEREPLAKVECSDQLTLF